MSSDLSIKPLYSSSEGNCTLITVNGTHILIDLGKSCRLITNALIDSGVYPDDVAAIFVTHGHKLSKPFQRIFTRLDVIQKS